MKISKNIFQTLVVRGGVAVVNMAIVFLTLNVLGADGRGKISLFLTDLSLVLILVNILSGSTIAYHVKKMKLNVLIRTSYLWTVLIAVMPSLVLMYVHKESIHKHLYFIAVLNGFFSANQMIFIGRKDIERYNFLFLLQPTLVVSSLIFMIFVVGLRSINSYVISLYVSFGIVFLISVFFVFRDDKKEGLSDKVLKSIYRYGLGNEVSVGVHLLNNRFLYYIIYEVLGAYTLGLFSVAVSITESVLIISRSISVNQYSEILNMKEIKDKIRITNKSIKNTGVYTIIAIVVLLLIPENILGIVIKEDIRVIKECMCYLSIGVFFHSIGNIYGNYFSGLGRYKENIQKSLIGFVLLIVGWFLLSSYGLIGACLSMMIGYFSSFIFLFFLYKKEVSF
ncbi:hypothetical protein AXE80_12405 [Wenyingzhuangia fucanilytica]|uniref:Uncharacterized protein n=1 Tax=Wenyingzhuangia fucanilytica TaxID=1790137 RepID=A0A1B1Y8F0_9FLAO|nr:polysaccharide biosynthesis C-terminal domain-containing protein [Wenyingzhuangia fucanilytica]ANW97036.1 hypothetical protein AXE80_12405 [Wenyingzhuangia fucanilytica]